MISLIKNNTRKITTLSLIALLISSAPTAQATDVQATLTEGAYMAAYTTLGLAVYRLLSRKPEKHPKKTNWDELFAGENVTDNLENIINNDIIGQTRKSGKTFANPDNGFQLETGPSIDSCGAMGWVHSNIKNICITAATLAFVKLLVDAHTDKKALLDNNPFLKSKFSDLGFEHIINLLVGIQAAQLKMHFQAALKPTHLT